MSIKKNFVVMILIITAAIIVLAGAYCLALETFWFSGKSQVAVRPVQQNQAVDEPADWKTYKNDEFKFELKYPLEWTLKAERSPIQTQRAISFSLTKSPNDDVLLFSVSGIPANEIQGAPTERQIFQRVGESNGYIFVAFSPDHYSISSAGVRQLEKILSTFKFTNSGLIDMSDWKTYKNEKYGFSFKYPADWISHTTANGASVLTTQHESHNTNGPLNGTTEDFYVSACNLSDKVCSDYKKDLDMQINSYSQGGNDLTLTIDGVTGSQWVFGADQYAYNGVLVRDGVLYHFDSTPEDYFMKYPSSIADKQVKAIFDSFKFTN